MEAKIIKKASPFMLVLLMLVAIIPAAAQRNVRNQHRTANTDHQDNSAYKANNTNAKKNYRYSQPGRYGNSRVYAGYRGAYNYGRPAVNVSRVCAPVGTRVRVLPRSVIRLSRHNQNFFYSYGNFYVPTHFGYRVVEAPIGARVTYLPQRARRVLLDRQPYFLVDNVYFVPVINRYGQRFFEVAGYA